jgi:predicted transcriptional regulator
MRVTTAADLASVVRERRQDLGMSQVQLAELAGVSRRTVVDFESGKSSPRIDHALRMIDAVEWSVQLVDDSESVRLLESIIGGGSHVD